MPCRQFIGGVRGVQVQDVVQGKALEIMAPE